MKTRRNTSQKKRIRRTYKCAPPSAAHGGGIISNSYRQKFIQYFLEMIQAAHRIRCIQRNCKKSKSAKCANIVCNTSFKPISIEEQADIVYKKYQSLKPKAEKQYNKYNIILACIANSCMSTKCSRIDLHYRRMNMDVVLNKYFAFCEKYYKNNPSFKKTKILLNSSKRNYKSITEHLIDEKIDAFEESTFEIFETFYHDFIAENRII
jgi:hypothetical protein